MKYIDKVYKTNADDETYIEGVCIEITNTELKLIKKSLEYTVEMDVNYLHEKHMEMLFKINEVIRLKGLGFAGTNTEINV